MEPEILLVRRSGGYSILHGHLHLHSVLKSTNEVMVDASGKGKVKVIKTASGIFICEEDGRLPLLAN